jgi:MoaA/NifB/PqqE/SkfB family radical SAM enzyme
MITLPPEVNYAEAYITLRCGFGCPGCVNDHTGVDRSREELTPEQWAESLNQIDFGTVTLTIGGGEPGRYKDLNKLINLIDSRTRLNLLTNLSFDVDEFIRQVDPIKFTAPEAMGVSPFYHAIRVSYHAGRSDQRRLITECKKLQKAGFNVGIFGVAYPLDANDNMAMAMECARAGMFFFPKQYLGRVEGEAGEKIWGYYKYPKGLDGVAKNAKCKTRELLISPDGLIYRCHRDLYHSEFPVGDIKDRNLEIKTEFRPCKQYGFCNPCDVRGKIDKSTGKVGCQVTIEEL